MNGIQSEWYASGQKKSEKNYQNNQQNGISLYWGVNGNLKRKALFIKGVEISYHLYDYHKNGQKREEASYKNGSKNGPWKRWDKNGELIFESTYDPRFVRNEIPKVDQSQYLFKDQHTTLRIDSTNPEKSALIYRMLQRGNIAQMPPIATHTLDDEGIEMVKTWIEELP